MSHDPIFSSTAADPAAPTESGGALAHVGEERRKRLERMVEEFQSEPDDAKARRQWKEIEKIVFGARCPD
jgi:hypothetical protein